MGLFGLNQRQLGHMLHGFGQGVTNIGQTLSRKKELEEARKRQEERDAKLAKRRKDERLSDREWGMKLKGTDAEAKRIKDRQERRAKGETAESQMRRRDLAAQAKDLAQTQKNESNLDYVVDQVILGFRKAPNPQVAAMAAAKVQKGFSSPGPEDEHDKLYQKWIKDEVPDGELTPRQIQRFETRFKKETTEKESKKGGSEFSRLYADFRKEKVELGKSVRPDKAMLERSFADWLSDRAAAEQEYLDLFPQESEAPQQTTTAEPSTDQSRNIQGGGNGSQGGDVAKYTAQHQEIFGGGQPTMPLTGNGGIDYYNAYLTQNQQGAGEEGVGDALPEIGGEEDDGAIDITDMMNPGARFDPAQDEAAAKADSLFDVVNNDLRDLSPEEEAWLIEWMEDVGLISAGMEQ